MKKLIVVLCVILALLLTVLAGRHFVRAHRAAPREAEPAVQEAVPAPAPEPEPEPEPEPKPVPDVTFVLEDSALQSFIEQMAEKYHATGMQVAILNDGEVIGSYACGWATLDADPMTTAHKIRVASVSKVVVGMAAMLLQEEGAVDLDEDVGAFWGVEAVNPHYPRTPITPRMILEHTSTLLDYEITGASSGEIRSLLTYGYMDTEPGKISSWLYNNFAFGALGATLELAAGQTLDELLDDRLFGPLDIDASFAGGDLDDPALAATLYRGRTAEYTAGWQQSLHLDPTPGENAVYYAGGLTISAGDLAKLVALLAGDGVYAGERLLSEDSVAQMEAYQHQPLEDGSFQAHPLLYIRDVYGRDGVYYHPGTAYGVNSCISYDPDTGDGVVVITTGVSDGADRFELYDECDEINEFMYKVLARPIDRPVR